MGAGGPARGGGAPGASGEGRVGTFPFSSRNANLLRAECVLAPSKQGIQGGEPIWKQVLTTPGHGQPPADSVPSHQRVETEGPVHLIRKMGAKQTLLGR